ncbi:XrtA system polysaccharide chain length determinant [Pelagibius marinus]|uniref:XrtA system polysaccharide chain length determinant n=1 Tax=Pelagibius marinus TaxID=2762760 RepID=UPI0018725AFC|nr:XrtA system polysaccharide chain length determinant [Pelagibius marinus]
MIEFYKLFFHYLNALWKRRYVALLTTWVIAIAGWMVVASLPSIYQSSSRIYVDTSSVLQPLLRGIAVQIDLRTQVQLIKQTLLSRPNLIKVAHETDYDLSVSSDAQMQAVINKLVRDTSISSDRQNIFTISFRDSDRHRAHKVVEALLALFVESNLGQSRQDLDTAEEFIDRQIADYEARLVEAENRLTRFKQENIDVVLGEGSYLSRARAANDLKQQYEQSLEVAIAQRNHLRSELKSIPETLPSELLNTGPPDDTERRIVAIEAQLRELRSRYTEKHPDVVSLRRQLAALLVKQEETQNALAEAAKRDDGGGVAETVAFGTPNPVYGQIQLRLIEIETQVEDLRRRAASARKEADALATKAEDVPQVEAEYQRLNRDYGIVKARFDELLSRRESARMSRSRDAIGQQVQYRLIDPPVVASKPIGPNRPLYLSAVLAVALCAGLGVALVLALLDTSFESAAELRDFTGLRVLGAISDTKRPVVTVGSSAAILLSGVAALVGTFGILLVIEQQYGLSTIVAGKPGVDTIESGTSFVINKFRDISDLLAAHLN